MINHFIKNRIQLVIFVLIFIGTLLFFCKVNPLIVFDTDDWYYMYNFRWPIPLPGSWNPSKVFPEVLMPSMSILASYIVYPITKDFVLAQSIFHGIVVSIIVFIYIFKFYQYMMKLTNDDSIVSAFLSLLFFIFHFLIFRCKDSDNVFMFYSSSVTNYYNYMLPSLLNATLVLSLLKEDFLSDFYNENNLFRNSIYLILIYFSIFSNIYTSIILISYILFDILRNAKNILYLIKCANVKIIICFIFLITCVLELFGGRAARAVHDEPFLQRFGNTIFTFVKNTHFNKVFILIFLVLIALMIINFVIKNIKFVIKDILNLVFSYFITLFYVIILSSIVNPSYISRSDVSYGFMFFFLVITFTLLAKLYNDKHFKLLLPFICTISLLSVNSNGNTFKDVSIKNANLITNDIVKQVIYSVNNNQSNMDLYIPRFDSSDNFPIAMYANDRISTCLFKHGIVPYNVGINFIVDSNKNIEFNLQK